MTPAQFRARRLALGLTQVQLAEALGLTRRAIWCYEVGRSPIPRTVELALREVCTSIDVAAKRQLLPSSKL